MSHTSVRQIPGSGSVNSIHPEKNEMWKEIQSVLCVSVTILSVIYWLNRVYGGHRESRARRGSKHGHVRESRRTGEVTAGVEDEEIRAVYVSCPIHLHWDAFISTLGEKRPCPLPCSLRFWSINTQVLTTAVPVCSVRLFRTVACVRVFACTSSSRLKNQMQQFETDVNVIAAHHSNIIFIYRPAITPKWFSPRCRKNKHTVTSSSVTEGFILLNMFPPWSFLSVQLPLACRPFHLWLFDAPNFHHRVICASLRVHDLCSSRLRAALVRCHQGRLCFPWCFVFAFLPAGI